MHLRMAIVCVACLTLPTIASAQQILRGTLKKLDLAAKTMQIEVDGKEREYELSDQTHVLDATGDTLAEKLKEFKAGAAIFLRPERRGERDVLTGLRLVRPGENNPRPQATSRRGDMQQGVVKAVDIDGRKLTLQVGDKELEVTATDRTEFRNIAGDSLAARLGTLAKDQRVVFVAEQRDERWMLVGIMRGEGGSPTRTGERVSPDHSAFKPLTELGDDKYQGFSGGLYPNGKNTRPEAHEQAGLRLAKSIRPLNADGQSDAAGKIVLLSVGMSNTSQISSGLQAWLREQTDALNPQMVFVNGAQGGMTAEAIQDADDGRRGAQYWRVVDERLEQAGVTRAQVQAVWIKQADGGPTQGFPGYAKKLQGELQNIVQLLARRFPNCRVAYLSSRTYGGFATTTLNPEPVAYESGFAVKWLIEEQLKGTPALNYDSARGEVRAPWLSWGPYLWANGTTPRSDGFRYEVSDFAGDGTHHASDGQRKTGQLLGKFLLTDATSRVWFAKP